MICGHFIQHASRRKKEWQAEIRHLEAELASATTELKHHSSTRNRGLVYKLRRDLDLYLMDRAERHLRWTKQKFNADPNKLALLLANKLKSFEFRKPALSLKTRFQVRTSNSVKILDEFQFHLAKLYSSGLLPLIRDSSFFTKLGFTFLPTTIPYQ